MERVRFYSSSGSIEDGYRIGSKVVKSDAASPSDLDLSTISPVDLYHAEDLKLAPPIKPETVVRLDGCYSESIERGRDSHLEAAGMEFLNNPTLWVAPNSSLVGSDASVPHPRAVDDVRPGVELGIVIGEKARNVNPSNANDYIAGYTVCRTLRAYDENPGLYGYKMFDGFLGVGPSVVSRTELPVALGVRTNAKPIDICSSADMRFSVPDIVSYVTDVMTLAPGDIITTGEPTHASESLTAGDTVTAWIEGIGSISTKITDGRTE